METASVSHDEEHQHAVISFADGAKVQQKAWRAVFPVIIGKSSLRPSQTCKCTREYLFRTLQLMGFSCGSWLAGPFLYARSVTGTCPEDG